jgi:exo-beta-1,3-glucanase (GH17 family)
LAQKFGWAIGGAGTGWLLAYFDYVPNMAQGPRAINGIMLMMSVIPAAGAIIAIVALWFYQLDEATVKTMSDELAKRRAREPQGDDASALQPVSPRAVPAPLSATASEFVDTIISESSAQQVLRAAPSAPLQPAWAGKITNTLAGAGLSTQLTPQQQAALVDEFRSVFQAGMHGLCFSPYLQGQAPGSQVSTAQIRERLELIRPHTRWIRTFSCTDGHEQTPAIAHEMGMRTLVGAWLGTDRQINEREIMGVIEVARAGHADIVAIGNEVLLREDMSEDELLAIIERVKQALPGVQVGYVDAYYLFEKHPRITAACDVVLTNCYPFWEGCPREQAIEYMQSMVRRTVAVAHGKRVIVSETGWPNQGSPFHGAQPSVPDAMRYFIDTQLWARQDGVEVFYFSAFDEAWKVGAEGDVGAYWGLWDKDGKLKYA